MADFKVQHSEYCNIRSIFKQICRKFKKKKHYNMVRLQNGSVDLKTGVEDYERTGRPVAATSGKGIDTIKKLIKASDVEGLLLHAETRLLVKPCTLFSLMGMVQYFKFLFRRVRRWLDSFTRSRFLKSSSKYAQIGPAHRHAGPSSSPWQRAGQ